MNYRSRWARALWLIPFLAFFLYIQLAGYPLFFPLVAAFSLFTVLAFVGILPYRSLYVCGLALLITCPLWRIVDNDALLGRNYSLLRLAAVIHMGDANEMALNAASASFAIFSAGVLAELLRRVILRRE